MRALTPETQALVDTRMGTEPFVIIAIEWETGTRYYGDKDTVIGSMEVEGRIIELSAINAQSNDKSLGMAASITVTLSDHDEHLKNIFRDSTIIYRKVTVYHLYEGLDANDLVPILVGHIATPVTWSDGQRTLELSLINDADSEDVLLEIKENNSDFPNEDDLGKVLPLGFGTVLRLPTVKINQSFHGELLGFASSNTTWYQDNDPSTSKITINDADFRVRGLENVDGDICLEADNAVFCGNTTLGDNELHITGFNVNKDGLGINPRPHSDADYENPAVIWVSDTKSHIGDCYLIHINIRYKILEFTDLNGKDYTQLITDEEASKLRDAEGNNVSVTNRTKQLVFAAEVQGQNGNKLYLSQGCVDHFGRDYLIGNGATLAGIKGKPEYAWSVLPSISDPLVWVVGPGTEVTEYNGAPALYIFNSVASNQVLEVLGRRDGFLEAFPSNSYTITLAGQKNVNGHTETLSYITFPEGINYQDGWSDDVYVSYISSIGENTATDAIDWIVNHRTSLTPDSNSFNHVGSKVQNYPSDFCLLTQRDALQAISEIAWQARIGTYVDANKMYLKYLSEEGAPGLSITESDVKIKTMGISKTSSDDIYTKFTANWFEDYIQDHTNKVVVEMNKNVYKYNAFTADFIIYNRRALVEKSITFWANRMSTSWYTIQVTTFLRSLPVQIWDNILIQLSDFNFGQPTNCIVVGINHDTDTNNIVLDLWTPINRTGNVAYISDSGDTAPPPLQWPNRTAGITVPTYTTRRVGPIFHGHGIVAKDDEDPNMNKNISVTNKGKTTNGDNPKSNTNITETAKNTTKHVYVDDIQNDYLICKYVDEEGHTIQIRVAKPQNLMVSDHALSFKTFTNSEGTEISYSNAGTQERMPSEGNKQITTPPYKVGEDEDCMITITYSPENINLVVNDEKLVWRDMNVDGRNWGEEADE